MTKIPLFVVLVATLCAFAYGPTPSERWWRAALGSSARFITREWNRMYSARRR
jgi:hypothetical protein